MRVAAFGPRPVFVCGETLRSRASARTAAVQGGEQERLASCGMRNALAFELRVGSAAAVDDEATTARRGFRQVVGDVDFAA